MKEPFYYELLTMSQENKKILLKSITDNDLIAIMDEAEGHIIAYAVNIKYADSIIVSLTMNNELQKLIKLTKLSLKENE